MLSCEFVTLTSLYDLTKSTAWDKEESLEQEKTDGVRRSQRNAGKPKPNYKHLNEGPPMWLTEGNTSVSSHLAQDHVHGEIKDPREREKQIKKGH